MPDRPPRLVLASTSPHRRALMARLGLPFEVASPGVDEDAFKTRGLPPRALVRSLARAKATALAPGHPEAVLIGSDQGAVVDGEVLGKPGGREAAIAQLVRLRGRVHTLLTAVAVHDARTGRTWDAVDVHTLAARPLTDRQIARYVDLDEPFDCAGSYRFEARGFLLFRAVRGGDDSAILGLPLVSLVGLLARVGIDPLA